MDELEKLKKLAEALDPLCNLAMDLPAGEKATQIVAQALWNQTMDQQTEEIAQTADVVERYKIVCAILSGVLVRQLTRAGIAPDLHEGWGPLEQRLSKLV